MLKLILPAPEYKEQVLSYKKEFIENGDSMDGCGGLDLAETFEDWFENWKNRRSEETVQNGWVPATTYLAVNEEGVLVGMIDIRHRLNDSLLQHGGHIGYSIRKSQRRKGYAAEMLGLALKECPKYGIERALVTCAKTNIGSAKTIMKNGGVLENEIQERERITQRYWIHIIN